MDNTIGTIEPSDEFRHFDFKDTQFNAQKTGFINRINCYAVSKHTPHHNGYDMVFHKEDDQFIDGKFQYGDFRKDLQSEWISIYAWPFSSNDPCWEKIGRVKTDSDGRIHFTIPDSQKFGQGLHLVKLFVEGDGTCANMYIQVLGSHNPYVVFDIDGTLATDDFENIHEYLNELWNGNYVAKMYDGAADIVRFYASLGYNILYLSSRPYWLSEKSHQWLKKKGFPMGLLHTYEGSDVLTGRRAAVFKESYLKNVISKGVHLACGYGNAVSDIEAYYAAGLTGEKIYIIGENAGISGTVGVINYPEHIKTLLK